MMIEYKGRVFVIYTIIAMVHMMICTMMKSYWDAIIQIFFNMLAIYIPYIIIIMIQYSTEHKLTLEAISSISK